MKLLKKLLFKIKYFFFKLFEKINLCIINLKKKIKNKKQKITRLELLENYLKTAKNNDLLVNVQINYDNELILNLCSKELTTKQVKKNVKKTNELENELKTK